MRDELRQEAVSAGQETENGRESAEGVKAAQPSAFFSFIPHPSSLIPRFIPHPLSVTLWLFLMVAAAPLSIAATQIAWVCGLLVWVVRLVKSPRQRLYRTPVDYALLGFFILTFISSLASYDPEISIGKLRAASLFTIVYLVAENVFSRRVLRVLALTLVASSMITVVYVLGERIVGRGIKVQGVRAESPLAAAGIRDGDTLLEVGGRRLHRPEELVAALSEGVGTGDASALAPASIRIYRYEWMPVFNVQRGKLLEGATAEEKLGIREWSRGRDWRASGYYGHYTTYAEVLQLITSLAFGLFIALRNKRSLAGALLLVAVLGLGFAMLLTVTRASWLSLLLSAFIIVTLGASRRTLLILVACALPLVFAGLFVLQQKRNVGFFDPKDDSIRWRETVQREGFQLLVSRPRHLLVGVGMDSIKHYWRQWGMFDNGRLPIGHMHSTPLQLALERGIPALLMWLALVFVYVRMLWRLVRRSPDGTGWIERGIALGALGGTVGFFASGLVHYNLGDSEVAMVFYIIMGLSLVVERESRGELAEAED